MTHSEKPGRSSHAGDLERLRDLLLGEDQGRLYRLDHRVSDLEARTSDVAEVLPGAMNRLVGNPVTKPDIEQPIVSTIRGAIKRDTESFAEALFPVLGPAIRRAVADALKSLVQRINVALENSFTVNGLRWRLEAARSGVPFAQVVLRNTMVFAVQEVFLIQRSSGLVLASVRRDEALALDEDAVSAMLTAIQSFIQDSFGLRDDVPLRSAELGEQTLWVINGPRALLACIITGSPPREVRDELMEILETLHAQYGDRFDEHPEVIANQPGVNTLLLQTLREELDERARGSAGSRSKILWAGLAIILVALLAWGTWWSYQDRRLETRVAKAFSSEPGYVLTNLDARRGVLALSGLRDPLARSPEAVLAHAGLDVSDAHYSFQAFQSLEADLVIQRVRAGLGADGAVGLALDGSNLRVQGSLGADQVAWLNRLPATHPVIQTVTLEQSRLAARDAEQLIRESLRVPDAVSIDAGQGVMVLSGEAEAQWFESVAAGVEPVGGWAIDLAPLRTALTRKFENLRQEIDGQEIRFSSAYRVTDDSQPRLDALAHALVELQALAPSLGFNLSIRLQGHADGVGTVEENREVAMTRARTVLAELGQRGVNIAGFVLDRAPWSSGGNDSSRRKVVVFVARATGA